MPARNLRVMPAAKAGAAQERIQVVLYARVSSKDQEEEGFSIQAQLRLLQEYAASRCFVIVKEFVVVESARRGDRSGFSQMVQHLKTHQATCRTILVEKTDRLYPASQGLGNARRTGRGDSFRKRKQDHLTTLTVFGKARARYDRSDG